MTVEVNNILTIKSGYTALEKKLYRSGRFVGGYATIKKNDGFFSSAQETVATISDGYISCLVNYGCFLSDQQWNNKDIGYAFCTEGVLISYSGNKSLNIAKINFQLFQKN